MLATRTDTENNRVTRTLDAVEDRLPSVPRMIFHLNRSVASLGCRLVGRAVDAVGDSGGAIADSATVGARTVRGQARSAIDRTVATGTGAANEVTGQLRAQSERVLDTIDSEARSLVEDATTVTEESEIGSYEGWTKTELYDRAQELDIDGRSTMNKAGLIQAIIAAT